MSGPAPQTRYSAKYLAEYNGSALRALAIALIPIETIFVALRFYARKLGKVHWGADDYLIILGLILCLGLNTAVLVDLDYGGIGWHIAAVQLSDPGKLVVRAKFLFILALVYLATVVPPKLAILLIYLRIFTQRPYRVACYVVGAALIANWVGGTVAAGFMCRPLSYLWNRRIPGGRCFNIDAYFRYATLTNIATDVVMLVLPLPVIWKIQNSTGVKIGLALTFALGSLGLITSTIRFAGFFTRKTFDDGTYSALRVLIFTICECGVYLLAACLLCYRPLILYLMTKSPLSSLRLRRLTRSKYSSSQRTYDIDLVPLEARPKSNLSRLDDDRTNSV